MVEFSIPALLFLCFCENAQIVVNKFIKSTNIQMRARNTL